MAIKNIPNQPIQFDIPIYETCQDERLNCALFKENDGDFYTQFELEPCTADVPIPDIQPDPNWSFISSRVYQAIPAVGGGSVKFIQDWGLYGNYFSIKFKFTGITAGSCNVDFTTGFLATITENGTYTLYSYNTPFSPPNDPFIFYADNDFNGKLEVIAVDAYYIPTNVLDWISVFTFKDVPYTIDPNCLNVTMNQNRVNLSIDPSCFEPNCYYLQVCNPCLAQSIAPEYSLDGAIGWTDANNCFYTGCDFPATINYTTSIEVFTSGNAGNLIEILFTSPTTSLNYSNCCYEIKIYFGRIDAMNVSIQMSRDNCQETFTPQAYSTKSIICCSYFDKIEFNLLIEETINSISKFEIEKVEIIPTIQCFAGQGNCYNTNCFQILAFNDPTETKLVTANCDNGSYQLGFFWDSNFMLKQRLPVYKFAPTYANEAKDYIFSDGSRKITSAQRMKLYDIVFAGLEEYQHDTTSTQILCKNFYIDGELYFVQPDDYKPEWNKNVGYPRADVRMLAMKQGTIIFRENQN